MPGDQDFLKMIQANPQDATLKLIYDDWLDEQGDPKGELIRLFVEVQELVNKHPNWRHFRRSVKENFGSDDVYDLINLLDKRQQRLFACQCADRVLDGFEKRRPDLKQPRNAVELARRYAKGQVSIAELTNARDAAWDTGVPARRTGWYGWWAGLSSQEAAIGALSDNLARPTLYCTWIVERLLDFTTE